MRRALLVLGAVAALVAVPLAGADADFTDPAGDAGDGPDVVGILVANDAQNRVAFSIELAGKKPLGADGQILIVVDTDQSSETGTNGWDYLIIVAGDESHALLAWNGTEWADAPAATARALFEDGYVLYGISRTELGNTTAFDFAGSAYKVAGDEIVAEDVVPDGDAFWSYATVAKTYGVGGSPLVASPKAPKAGAKFGAGFFVFRTDSIEPLEGAAVTCIATLAGKRIAARGGYGNEVAGCSLTLPKTAKGKLLKLTVRASAGGKTVTRAFSAKVK